MVGTTSWDAGTTWDDVGTFDLQPTLTIFSATTMRWYNRLPARYRNDDVAVNARYNLQPPNDYPLLRFMAAMGEQAAEVEALLDLLEGPDSALGDPNLADPSWLAWLASVTGAILPALSSVATQRAIIESGATTRQAGNRSSIIAIAKQYLTGGKSVQLVDHVGGDMWQMQIVTRPSETPSPDPVLPAILAANVLPAGVTMTHAYYEASWETIEKMLPGWEAWGTAGTTDPLLSPGSWGAIEETQPPAVASWATIEAALTSWAAWDAEPSWAAIEGIGITPGPITQINPTAGVVSTDGSAGFTDQLNVIGGIGQVSFTQTAGSPSLAVSSTGGLTTSGALATGTYTASGTVTDPFLDTGTWTYTLTVNTPATWAMIEAALPTWSDWSIAGSWQAIEAQT